LAKFKLFWFFVWALRVGKNQMCLNVRSVFYNEAQRPQAGVRCGFKDSKFKIFPHDELFQLIEKLLSRTDALPAVIGCHFIHLVLCQVVVALMNDR